MLHPFRSLVEELLFPNTLALGGISILSFWDVLVIDQLRQCHCHPSPEIKQKNVLSETP